MIRVAVGTVAHLVPLALCSRPDDRALLLGRA